MKTISLRINNEDEILLRNYVKINKLNLSEFIRTIVMEKIEDELALDEERILKSLAIAEQEEKIPHEEVWKRLGI